LINDYILVTSERCGCQAYGIFIVLWQFLIPLLVFVVVYWKILAVVRRQAKVMADHQQTTPISMEPVTGTSGTGTTEKAHSDRGANYEMGSKGHQKIKGQKTQSTGMSKAKINVVKTMMYITVCFILCWMPFYIMRSVRQIQVS